MIKKKEANNNTANIESYETHYPFNVAIKNQYEGNDLPALYIVDRVDPLKNSQNVIISITRGVLGQYTWHKAEGAAGPNNYNLALVFRPGTIREEVKEKLEELIHDAINASGGDEKSVNAVKYEKRAEDKADIWYVCFNKDLPNFTGFTFTLKGVSAELGIGARRTQVEFLFSNMIDEKITENFTRTIHVEIINHLGSPHTPMYFGILGKNTLLNQPGYTNTLTIYFETIGRIPVQLGPHTEIDFYFPYAGDTIYQELFFGSKDEVKEYVLEEPSGETDAIVISENNSVSIKASYPNELNGLKVIRASFNPIPGLPAGKPYPKLSSLQFNFSNLKISGSDGIVMLGVNVRNVPGYWDTDFHIPIVKETSQLIDGALRLGTNKADGHLGLGSRIDFLSDGIITEKKGLDTQYGIGVVSIEANKGLNLIGEKEHPVIVRNASLQIGSAEGEGKDWGSRIEFLSSGYSKDDEKKVIVKIEENKGLNFYGDKEHPVEIQDCDLKIMTGNLDIIKGNLEIMNNGDCKVSGDSYVNGNVFIGKLDKEKAINILNVAGGVAIGAGFSNKEKAPENGLMVEGKVGIGTTSSLNKLDVNGAVVIGESFSGKEKASENGLMVEGNVNIGTANKKANLEVTGDCDLGDNCDSPHINISGQYIHAISGKRNTSWMSADLFLNNGGNIILCRDGSNVGIGTDKPEKARLELSGSTDRWNNITNRNDLPINDQLTFLNGVTRGTAEWKNLSLYAQEGIAAQIIYLFSDGRVKNIKGRSEGVNDLMTLLQIEITDFQYKDFIENGTVTYKKGIAQQIEKVFPQAVSKNIDVVPDIYKSSKFNGNWIELTTDLKKGDRVKLISDKDKGIYEVLEVAKDKFRTDFKPEGANVFVYGREVDDFLSVDYDAISMLNVSATQQIKKELDAAVAENSVLKVRVAALEKQEAFNHDVFSSIISRLEMLEKRSMYDLESVKSNKQQRM